MGLSDVELIERLDSLWFFSNPLVPSSLRDQNTQAKEEFPSPNINAVTPSFQPNKEELPMGEPLTPKSSIFCDQERPHEAMDVVPLICSPCYYMGSPEPKEREEEEETRSFRRRKRFRTRKRNGKRTILGEFELDLEDYCGLLVVGPVEDDEEGNRSGSHDNQVKLPPLNLDDAMAMKEHLKSWAYAVACTVR